MALSPGARVGPYEITAQVGVGGMGEVYRANDTNLKRAVAIKVLPDALATDAERLARFQREAEVLASLNHPNIAAIYGLERTGATTAIVMELVEGPTLAHRIAEGPIPINDALVMAKQIAEGLEAAHERGVIHRDLKPANIKLRPDGTVKILDFGLAKAFTTDTAAPSSVSLTNSPTLTSPVGMTGVGIILGTAAYMSPEQARGKPVDKRADIWAFGCVLYELLTGKRVFEAEDVSLTLAEVMKSEPEWSVLPPLPPATRICLQRCLKKDPRLRLRDIGEARLAVDGTLESDSVHLSSSAASRPDRGAWRSALPWAVAAAAIASALIAWLPPDNQLRLPEVVRFQIHAPEGSRIPPGTPAIAPDGRTVAYRMDGPDGRGGIYLRAIDSTESRLLAGTENAVHPFWSPDGRSLAFVSNRVLKRVDVAGGSPRELASQIGGPWHGSWNQFGDLLFVTSGVFRMPAEGGRATPAVQLNAAAGEFLSNFPAFLPDGRRFLVNVSGDQSSALHLASMDSPERRLIVDDINSAVLVAPTPQGTYLLYLRDETLVAHQFDLSAGKAVGTPRVLVEGMGKVANPPIMPAAGVSASGGLAYQVGGDFTRTRLSWVDRSGTPAEDVPLDVSFGNFSLSPDGRLVAYDSLPASGREVRVMDLSRGGVNWLLAKGGIAPVWSPNSRRVAFQQSGKIYVTDVDGGKEATVLADVNGRPRAWSTDEKYLLFETVEGSANKLFLWPLEGGSGPIAVGGPRARDGRFSSDGRYIAYVAPDSGRAEIFVQAVPPATGLWKVSSGGGTQPRWSSTDRQLFFITSPETASRALMAADMQFGAAVPPGVPHKLFDVDFTFGNFGYDVSGDGQRFLISQQRRTDLPNTPITVVLNWWVEFAKPPN